ncbi:hypothetical protein ACF0H5_014851 [Mactra antiquata]
MLNAPVYADNAIIETKNERTISDEHEPVLQRNKKSDCWWQDGVNMDTTCYCGDNCWKDTYGGSFYSQCHSGLTSSCCIVMNNNAYQLSSNCPVQETYLDISCSQNGQTCGDGLPHYDCTCSEGFLQGTTTTIKETNQQTTTSTTQMDTTEQTTTQKDFTKIVIPSVIGGILAFVIVAIVCVRFLRKSGVTNLERMVENGFIPIRCNLMVLVDGLDEFKYYTSHVMVALREILPSIVCERLSIYHLLNDNYHIECDKLLVLMITGDENVLTEVMKKINFRNGTKKSVFIIYGEGNLIHGVDPFHAEIHLVPCIRNIELWLPPLLKILCRSKLKILKSRTNSYFINAEQSSFTDSIYCVQMRTMVENALISCGAVRHLGKELATCKLAFINMDTDNLDSSFLISHVIFVTSRANLEQYRKKTKTHVYGGHEVILGILHILKIMMLITNSKMPKINGARYDPMQMEFI